MKDSDIGDYLQNQKVNNEELANPTESIKNYLQGLMFPAQKEDIMKCAQRNEAPNQLLHIISEIPEMSYSDLNSLTNHFKVIG